MTQAIFRVDRVEARLVDRPWPWAQANAETIRAFWADAVARMPKSFDGEVFLSCSLDVVDGLCTTRYFATRYSAFLTWLRTGCPDESVMNGFAMAALEGSDGAFVLGVMAAHTQNAGQIYFPAGTPDREDRLAGDIVDLEGSLLRELLEETHLRPEEVELQPGWTIVLDGQKAAFFRPVRLAVPADIARQTILERLAREAEPELSGIVVLRSPDDIDEARMPDYLKLFLRDAFAARGAG